MSRAWSGWTAALVMATGLFTADPAVAQNGDAGRVFRIAAPSAEGPLFQTASLLASGLSSPAGGRPCDRGGSCGVPGMIAVVQSVAGADQALGMVASGRIEAALVWADALTRAREASGAALRTVATLHVTPLVVLERVDAADADPPRGGAWDLPGGGAALAGRLAGRLEPFLRVDPVPVGEQEGVARLLDGRIDRLFGLGVGREALTDALKGGALRVSAAPPARVRALNTESPWLVPVGEGRQIGLPLQFVVGADVGEERGQQLARALWHPATVKLLRTGPVDARIEEALVALQAPIHPGAAKFYREQGMVDASLE